MTISSWDCLKIKETAMRRITLTLALLLAAYTVSAPQTPAPIKTIPLPEVSGAVNIGNDRVMLIADEGYDVQIVSNAAATFKAGDPKIFESNMKPAIPLITVNTKESKKTVNDIEDVTWDSKEKAAFVITSHSVNTDEEVKAARYKLARLMPNAGPTTVSNVDLDVLKEALKKRFSFVSDAMTRPHAAGGNTGTFNIEGLAFDPGKRFLLLGLRSPTQMKNGKPCAVVFTLKNPHALFQKDKPPSPDFDAQLTCLDLGGLGIRGMTYDDERKGFWIVAGRSSDPNPEPTTDLVFSSLWFWDAAHPNKSPRRAPVDLSPLVNVEGVCLLSVDGRKGLLLISDDGDTRPSRYLWIPMPVDQPK